MYTASAGKDAGIIPVVLVLVRMLVSYLRQMLVLHCWYPTVHVVDADAGKDAVWYPTCDAGACEDAGILPVADAGAGEDAGILPVVDAGAGEDADPPG